jgi:hypothetical protein
MCWKTICFCIPLAVAALAGCTSDRVSVESRDRILGPGSGSAAIPLDENPLQYANTIGPSGGTVDGADADFDVPAEALADTVTITMTVSSIGGVTEVDMDPDGQTFEESCTLEINKPSGFSGEDPYHIFLWNETSEDWDDLGGTDTGSSVWVYIEHFSRYKIDSTAE